MLIYLCGVVALLLLFADVGGVINYCESLAQALSLVALYLEEPTAAATMSKIVS